MFFHARDETPGLGGGWGPARPIRCSAAEALARVPSVAGPPQSSLHSSVSRAPGPRADAVGAPGPAQALPASDRAARPCASASSAPATPPHTPPAGPPEGHPYQPRLTGTSSSSSLLQETWDLRSLSGAWVRPHMSLPLCSCWAAAQARVRGRSPPPGAEAPRAEPGSDPWLFQSPLPLSPLPGQDAQSLGTWRSPGHGPRTRLSADP